jgi:hypothetical protein
MDESTKQGANRAKDKVLSKDCIFYVAFFLLVYTAFFKFEAKYDIKQDKISFFLHQTLDYSQIYNFTLKDDYKFKTIIMLKDV